MSPRPLGEFHRQRVERLGVERHVRLDVAVVGVVDVDRDIAPVTGDVLDARVGHQRVDLGLAEEVPPQVVPDLLPDERVDDGGVLAQHPVERVAERLLVARVDVVVEQAGSQPVGHVLADERAELGQLRFGEVVPGLVALRISEQRRLPFGVAPTHDLFSELNPLGKKSRGRFRPGSRSVSP